MTLPLRLLILEDSPLDAELLVQELHRAGFNPDWQRVETEADYLAHLDPALDVILSDYHLPQFDGLCALRRLHDRNLDIPFIVVTGSFEEVALECMKEGAADYLIKDRLARLGPAVAHALEQRLLRDDMRRADTTLREREQRFRALVQHGSDVITVLDPAGRIGYVSPSVDRVLGLPPEELTDANFFATLHPDDVAYTRSTVTAVLNQPDSSKIVEFRRRHRDGSWRHLEAIATNLLDQPGVRGIVLNSRDITERKLLEQQLAHQAFYDSLTGLPNRALFLDRLRHALAASLRRPSRVAVMFLDLDGFKTINDSLGHPFGDEVLCAVAQRLQTYLRPEDTVARFGGDEFTILVDHVAHLSDITRLATRIIDDLNNPFTLHGNEVCATVSIGIALNSPSKSSLQPSDLLREADVALYQAKAEGRACFRLFDEAMNHRAVERLRLEAELRHAIGRDELQLHYQPIIDVQTGSITGVEALVRWQHPRLGLIAPLRFIPLAEETGFILQLDQWVLGEACRQAAAWGRTSPHTQPSVTSINLSARQFQQPDLVQRVERELTRTGLLPSSLELEITESTLMQDAQAAMRTLRALKDLGVRLAIDDFGTGYSSLSYVQRFAVDTLKIDQSFVAELKQNAPAAAILQAIVVLGHALGMEITAEGIETAEQLAFLRSVGCEKGQGYHFSKPLPPDAISRILDGPRATRNPLTRLSSAAT